MAASGGDKWVVCDAGFVEQASGEDQAEGSSGNKPVRRSWGGGVGPRPRSARPLLCTSRRYQSMVAAYGEAKRERYLSELAQLEEDVHVARTHARDQLDRLALQHAGRHGLHYAVGACTGGVRGRWSAPGPRGPDRAGPWTGGRQAGLGAALVRGSNKPGARDPGAAALTHCLGADVSQAVLHRAGVPHPCGAVVSGHPSGRPAASL